MSCRDDEAEHPAVELNVPGIHLDEHVGQFVQLYMSQTEKYRPRIGSGLDGKAGGSAMSARIALAASSRFPDSSS